MVSSRGCESRHPDRRFCLTNDRVVALNRAVADDNGSVRLSETFGFLSLDGDCVTFDMTPGDISITNGGSATSTRHDDDTARRTTAVAQGSRNEATFCCHGSCFLYRFD